MHSHTCAHNHGRLATEICHYTSDRLPPLLPLSSPHAPIFLPLLPVRASCRNARGLQQQQQRKMCCTAKYAEAAAPARSSAAEKAPTGASSSSATAAAAGVGGAPGQQGIPPPPPPGQQGIPGNPLIWNPLLASSYGVSTKRWCNCRQGTAISQFFGLSLTNTVSDPARSK